MILINEILIYEIPDANIRMNTNDTNLIPIYE